MAIQIALARAIAGKDIWLIDGDRQGTSQTAIAIRAEAGRRPGLACAQYPDGAVLRAQLQQSRTKFDDIVIDAGGRDSTALRAALVLTDILLVPFQPRSVDVWALGDIAGLIEEAQVLRPAPLRAYAVLNCADPGSTSSDNTEAAAATADHPAFTLLDAPVRRRKALANAVGQGLSVEEYSPRDAKACEEMATLIKIVFTNEKQIKMIAR